MHTLHLVGYDRARELEAKRAVRTALRDLGEPRAPASAADFLLALVGSDGYAFVGQHESAITLGKIREAMEKSGCTAEVDFVPPSDPEPGEAEPAGFSKEAYETALALMGASNGNPLEAAVNARTLMHSTANADLYMAVIAVLAFVFRPWLPQMLEEQGMITLNEEAQ